MLQRAVNGNQYVKNYEFNFPFRGPWANSTVVMTSVIGHLTGLEFDIRFKNWQSCRPIELFDGRITEEVASVCSSFILSQYLTESRINKRLLRISPNKLDTAKHCLYGLIAIGKASTSGPRFAMQP